MLPPSTGILRDSLPLIATKDRLSLSNTRSVSRCSPASAFVPQIRITNAPRKAGSESLGTLSWDIPPRRRLNVLSELAVAASARIRDAFREVLLDSSSCYPSLFGPSSAQISGVTRVDLGALKNYPFSMSLSRGAKLNPRASLARFAHFIQGAPT